MKNILIVTHERSGTHLLINSINYKNNGDFLSMGYIPPSSELFTIDKYITYVHRQVKYNNYDSDVVFKSHHQIEFFEEIIDLLFEKYKIIYVKRDLKDVLISYYYFLNKKNNPIPNFPKFKDWIFMNPQQVGFKFIDENPDPHIIISPKNYIDRWLLHLNGWMKYKNRFLTVEYENLLNDFKGQKILIENYLNQKISDNIPDFNDKKLPNFTPNKGIIGYHKEFMDSHLIDKINKELNDLQNFYSEHK
jgi:hypothetical protein